MDQFVAEAGATPSSQDQVAAFIDAGLLAVWGVEGATVSMAAVTVAEGGVSRVQYDASVADILVAVDLRFAKKDAT